MDHLVSKLKSLKESITSWIKDKKEKDWEYFAHLEVQIGNYYQNNPYFSISEEDLLLIKDFEKKKDMILKQEEKYWRLKSIALWISILGDENTSFFHSFASNRRNLKSIWDLIDENGNVVKTQYHLNLLARAHFENIVKKDGQSSLESQLKTVRLFPAFFNEADNLFVQDQVTLKEILEGLK